MLPLTKIIATLGPSCQDEEKIKNLILNGANIFRFNLKHNTFQWHVDKIELVRKISRKLRMPIGILVDLEGGELRTGRFKYKEKLELKNGEVVIFTKRNRQNILKNIPLPKIREILNLTPGQKILIDDGKYEFKIKKIDQSKIYAKVIRGGKMEERKTINIPNSRIGSLINLQNDSPILEFCYQQKIDFLAISFVKESKDILMYKNFFQSKDFKPWIISKIEAKEAIKNFNEILEESDGIMIARGDLGTELPFEKVPFYQKMITAKALIVGKPVIISTHMLESMIKNPRPTRAEVSDIANALYDLSDCLMLAGETAYGKYPDLSVATMRKTANFIEKQKPENPKLYYETRTQTDAICFSAYSLYKSEFCQKKNVKAFVILSRSGKTARSLSRLRPYLPIFAVTENKSLLEKLTLLFGVYPLYLDLKGIYKQKDTKHIREILLFLRKNTFLKRGDKVIFVYGEDWDTRPGRTSVMRVQEVV